MHNNSTGFYLFRLRSWPDLTGSTISLDGYINLVRIHDVKTLKMRWIIHHRILSVLKVVRAEWLLCIASILIAFHLAHISYPNFTKCCRITHTTVLRPYHTLYRTVGLSWQEYYGTGTGRLSWVKTQLSGWARSDWYQGQGSPRNWVWQAFRATKPRNLKGR